MTIIRKKILALTYLIIALTIKALAQPGSLDNTFNIGTGTSGNVGATAVQSDGKIIIGGYFNTYNGTAVGNIARLNQDGTIDSTFNQGTGTNNAVNTISIQNDGKIIIGGDLETYNGIYRYHIARLNTDGTLDSTFNPGMGSGPLNTVGHTSIQNDGKIIVCCRFTGYNGIASLNLFRLNIDGSFDNTFIPGSEINHFDVGSTVIQNDGKIIISGHFASYNGTPCNTIARLNTDGSIDSSFNSGTGADVQMGKMAILNDGKIIVGGQFNFYNGTAINHIARINIDGTLDTSFNTDSGADMAIRSIAIQNDGKIIIAGFFTSYNGIVSNRLARLNADGSLDSTFNAQIGANEVILTTSIQSDGKIIIGGVFNLYNGIITNHIARINSDISSAIPNKKDDSVAIVIFPNPTSENISIQFTNDQAFVKVRLISIIGQELKSQSFQNTKLIDYAIDQAKGIYFIEVTDSKGIVSLKRISKQ